MIIPAELAYTSEGVPYSAAYDDVYYAAAGGLEQARHVFLAGNGLPERWRGRDSFVIVETGFGLGLNFLATWQAWAADAQRATQLHFVSVERQPFVRADLLKLHSAWPELAALAADLQQQWPLPIPGMHRLHFDAGRVTLTLLFGDAAQMLPRLVAQADALYLDGFAPAKNPDLWSPSILATLTRLSRPACTLATWSVAGELRQGLAAVGWQLGKRPGYAHKREMLVGSLPGAAAQTQKQTQPSRSVIIVGAGIAGCTLAERLIRRGWQVQLLERRLGPSLEGSGNPAGIFLPLPAKDDNLVARISRACFLYASRRLQRLAASAAGQGLRWDASGVVQLGRDAAHERLQRETVANLALPADYLRFLSADALAQLLGRPVPLGGWYFPDAGWLSPARLCQALLADPRIETHYACHVAAIEATSAGWLARGAEGEALAEATHLVLANAQEAQRFLPTLPLQRVRGQITCLPMAPFAGLRQALCRKSYLIPAGGDAADARNGVAYLGASFDLDDDDRRLRSASHLENLAGLEAMLPGALGHVDVATLPGRVGFRSMSPDRLPLAGSLPEDLQSIPSDLALADMPRRAGLHCLLGYGARGLVWSLLLAELLAAQLQDEPLPLERELVAALDPARFLLRQLRRR